MPALAGDPVPPRRDRSLGLHPREDRRRPGGGPVRPGADAVPAGAERVPAHRPRQVDLPELRPRRAVRRTLQAPLRRHEPRRRGPRVRGRDHRRHPLARLRARRGGARQRLLRPALRVGRGPRPRRASPTSTTRTRRRSRPSAAGSASRAPRARSADREPRGEPRPAAPDARRRLRRRREGAPGEDRHVGAGDDPARPGAVPDPPGCPTTAPRTAGSSTRPTTGPTASPTPSRASPTRSARSSSPTTGRCTTGASSTSTCRTSKPEQTEFARLGLTHTVMSKRLLRAPGRGRRGRRLGRPPDAHDPRACASAGYPRRGDPGVRRRDRRGQDQLHGRDRAAGVPRAPAPQRPRPAPHGGARPGEGGHHELARRARSSTSRRSTTPRTPSAGTRQVPFSGELWIERDDFMADPPPKYFRLTPGREVRLRAGYFITATDAVTDADGNVTEVHATYDPETRGGQAPDGRKVKATIHWVSAAHAVDRTVHLYERLFTDSHPGADGDAVDSLNPASRQTVHAKAEPALADVAPGEVVQLERLGYFAVDPDDPSTLHRTVGLRDEWANIQKRARAGRRMTAAPVPTRSCSEVRRLGAPASGPAPGRLRRDDGDGVGDRGPLRHEHGGGHRAGPADAGAAVGEHGPTGVEVGDEARRRRRLPLRAAGRGGRGRAPTRPSGRCGARRRSRGSGVELVALVQAQDDVGSDPCDRASTSGPTRCLPHSQSRPATPGTGTRSMPPLRERSLWRHPVPRPTPPDATVGSTGRPRGTEMTAVDGQASDVQQRGDEVLADLFFTPGGHRRPGPAGTTGSATSPRSTAAARARCSSPASTTATRCSATTGSATATATPASASRAPIRPPTSSAASSAAGWPTVPSRCCSSTRPTTPASAGSSRAPSPRAGSSRCAPPSPSLARPLRRRPRRGGGGRPARPRRVPVPRVGHRGAGGRARGRLAPVPVAHHPRCRGHRAHRDHRRAPRRRAGQLRDVGATSSTSSPSAGPRPRTTCSPTCSGSRRRATSSPRPRSSSWRSSSSPPASRPPPTSSATAPGPCCATRRRWSGSGGTSRCCPRPSRRCCGGTRRCSSTCAGRCAPAEVAGQPVDEGTAVVTLLGAANRDPGHFTDPDRFDVGRDEGAPMSFASGIHYCLGAEPGPGRGPGGLPGDASTGSARSS